MRFFVTVSCFLFSLGLSQSAPAQAPPPPAEYQTMYDSLEYELKRFQAILGKYWDGSKQPVVFSAGLTGANSNLGPELIEPGHFDSVLYELDGLEAVGVQAVTLSINFPTLYRPYFSSDSEYQAYLDFYASLAQEIKSRGLKLIVETQVVFTFGGFSKWENMDVYYDSLTLEEYAAGRAETAVVIAQQLAPDYLSLIQEADNEANQSRKSELGTMTGSTDLLNTMLAALQGAGVTGVKLGAGIGTWFPQIDQWTASYAGTDIDFVDVHLYPVTNKRLDKAARIATVAQYFGKSVGMTETWLYKAEDSELGILGFDELYARDNYSFFEPLDELHLKTIAGLAHFKNFEFVSPFWSDYFRAYLDYTPEIDAMSPEQIRALGDQAQTDAILQGEFTRTALAYQNAILGGPDLIPPTPPQDVTVTVVSSSSTAIEWGPGDDNTGPASYKVYRDGQEIYSGVIRVCMDEGLSDGQEYSYTIETLDLAGNVSAPSTPVVVTTPDVTSPSVPEGLAPVNVTETQIDLTWQPSDDNLGPVSYRVFWGASADNLAQIGFVEAPGFSHSGLAKNTTHYYAVQAIDAAGNESERSGVITASTSADTTAPRMPAGLTAVTVSDRQIDLSWLASEDDFAVVGYKVLKGTTAQNLSLVGFTEGMTFSDSGLPPSTTFFYAVVAVDSSMNESAPTPAVSATTEASPDTHPPTVTVAMPTDGATVDRYIVIAAGAYDVRGDLYDTPSGVAGVQFQIDGVNVDAEDTVAPYYIQLDTRTLSNGLHTVTAVARDNAGNTAEASITINVSN